MGVGLDSVQLLPPVQEAEIDKQADRVHDLAGFEMTLGQVAAKAGIRPSTLRYYESVGLLSKPSSSFVGPTS